MAAPYRVLTAGRRFQTKERVQLLFNGATKQKNASNYFPTALLNKRTRPITFQRRYQTKERVQLLSNGVTKQKNAYNYFPTAVVTESLIPGSRVFILPGRSEGPERLRLPFPFSSKRRKEGGGIRSNKERRQRTPAVVASFSEGLQLRNRSG